MLHSTRPARAADRTQARWRASLLLGEVEAEIGLPWPKPLSMAEEWLDEAPALPWLRP